ncbi:MAG: M20/M25/M40 family metallo-hydrolase [Anaerolineae bacterium]|jgi:acetylornithine deacetylase/succinyl-diaminopimelate desuccinylase-like protein|nr:M20/M25/M40 family metallo-hydrolase [Anaerolineae bacterium]MBT4310379.1 M20/M25/M40 family metallo-hydrolase [Anaerolineae bacterium]MBT4458895.1 M20/M25/M40 family metallo-hydrolase [Anaerolineae bacterium]MBT6062157.1 M20/M25/M40 family metallo-hydrolase [Anaerolineae bacterium]MBT6322619.1 M20/M25/M40 family metallo-hydrolase [Anaerolineae bacterium]
MTTPIYQKPVELLQNLIRFDTTNPPGNEKAIIMYLKEIIEDAGLKTTILAKDENRPNLITRLPGRGDAPPLLLYGHVDVVTTVGQKWTHPPFEGKIVDDMIWGRGALDMKGGIAMMVSALLRAHEAGEKPPGDIILAIVSDEEVDGSHGARFLTENHAELFDGVKYAIGEGGGVSLEMGGEKFYTVMVAEKQICSVRATVRGKAGHGSMPRRGGATAKLAKMLNLLENQRLPVHITPVSDQMLSTIGNSLTFPTNLAMKMLLNPTFTDRVLDALGDKGLLINPLLHNTVSPNIIRGGNKINVIPAEISVDLDGRLLPQFTPDDMLAELSALLGDDVELEVTHYDKGAGTPDMTLYPLLADILQKADPSGTPIPMLLSGVTDGRFFSRIGIQTYGYLPTEIPGELINTIHAANERVPVAAMEFGTNAISEVLRRFEG